MKRSVMTVVIALVAGIAIGAAAKEASKAVSMPAAEIKWIPMPGVPPELGLKIAPLWGDMQKGPYGFLLKLPAGYPGVLHTHSGDYHGIDISGTSTCAQEGQTDAKPLPPGSYWFQPGKAKHQNSCAAGADCVLYIHGATGFDSQVVAPPPAKK